jgi:hypothetical protein
MFALYNSSLNSLKRVFSHPLQSPDITACLTPYHMTGHKVDFSGFAKSASVLYLFTHCYYFLPLKAATFNLPFSRPHFCFIIPFIRHNKFLIYENCVFNPQTYQISAGKPTSAATIFLTVIRIFIIFMNLHS